MTLHDDSGELIHSMVREGEVDCLRMRYRELIEPALGHAAQGILLVHNHPSGNPAPSVADIENTRRLSALCRALDLYVHDHLIVAGESITSMRAAGCFA